MLFILAFILILTVGAYFNYSAEYADDDLQARYATPAKQMVVYHAALARYCGANDCTAAGSSVPSSSLGPYLPTYSANPLPKSYTDGTIRNISTGTYVVTYYMGRFLTGPGMGTKGSVLGALYSETPNDAMSSVGVFDGTQMRPRGFVYEVGLQDGTKTANVRYPVIAVSPPGAPVGAPMIASPLKSSASLGFCDTHPLHPSCI